LAAYCDLNTKPQKYGLVKMVYDPATWTRSEHQAMIS
jgi:hypothetical protein